MQELKAAGRFNVKVTECFYREMDQVKTPGAFKLILKLVTPDDFYTWYEMEFSNKPMPSGKRQGMKLKDLSIQTLKDIGVADGYIGNIKAAIDAGLEAEVTMKWEEWEDKKTSEKKKALRAKYLNPPSKMKNLAELQKLDIDTMLDGLDKGVAIGDMKEEADAAPPPAEPAQGEDANDNIPF